MTEYTEVIAENAGPIVIVSGPQGEQGIPGEDGAAGKSAFQSAIEGGYIGSEEDFYKQLSEIGKEKIITVDVGINTAKDTLELAETSLGKRKSVAIFAEKKGDFDKIGINDVECYADKAGAIRFDVYSWDGNESEGKITFAETLGEVQMGAAGVAKLELTEKYETELENICVLAVSNADIIRVLDAIEEGMEKAVEFEDGDYYTTTDAVITINPVEREYFIPAVKYDIDRLKTLTAEEAADDSFKKLYENDKRFEENDIRFADIEKEIADLKYEAPAVVSFLPNITVIETGDKVGGTGNTFILRWAINKKPERITLYSSLGSVSAQLEGEDAKAMGTISVENEITEEETFTIVVTDERGNTASARTKLNVYDRVYYGTRPEQEEINSDFILELSKELSDTKNLTLNIEGGEGLYFYYAYPKEMGLSKFNIGGFDYEYGYETIMFTNRFGVSKEYYVYRSGQPITENVSVTVKGG